MSLRSIFAGAVLLLAAVLTPSKAYAQTDFMELDGVMGQSLYEEQTLGNYELPSLLGATKYSDSFTSGSFTTQGKYTGKTYYHKAEYEGMTLFNGIDVSWWQSKAYNKEDPNYHKVTGIDWEKAHDDGIDFAFVRVASSDTAGGETYTDTAADSHIQGALENDINVGVYIFSQAMTEKRAVEEAEYVLDLLEENQWDVTLPIVMDREPGRPGYGPLKKGMLTKAKETAVEQAFIDTIVDAGYQAAVYANYDWFRNYINGSALENCQIWLARYNFTTTSNTTKGEAYGDVPVDYDFWQYTSTSVKMAGWPSRSLDMDFWYKDTSAQTTGLQMVTQSDGSVLLTWDEAAEDVTGYQVSRYDPQQGKYVELADTTDCTYTDTSVEGGQSYQYSVCCYWTIGGINYYGTPSENKEMVLPPDQVTGIRTEKQSSTYLTLAWDEVSGATGYRIYHYQTDLKKYARVADVTAETLSFKVEKLASAADHKFIVRAFMDTINGRLWGKNSRTYTETTRPLKTRGVTAVAGTSKITLSWNPVENASGYQVYRLNTDTGKYEKAATIRDPKNVTWKNTGLKKGKTYTYKVRAFRKCKDKNDYGVCSGIVKCKAK